MKFIDICAGIGGFRYGLEQAGHECVGFIEIDKFARKSYIAMYEAEGEWNAEDVTKIRAEEIPKADMWCFGFPCTDISVSGRRFGIDGARSGIFFRIMELVKGRAEKDRPKLLLVENVENLIRINGGWDFTKLLLEMESTGYDVEWQVYNSQEYNVSQSRKRVFIIGVLGGSSGRKILPFPRESKSAIKQIIGGCQGNRVYDTSGAAITLTAGSGGFAGKTGLYFIDMDRELKITDHARCIQARHNRGISNRLREQSRVLEVSACLTPEREKTRQNGRRFKTPNEPMFCLTAQDRHGIMINDLAQGIARIRRLTPKECFRLQGFPDYLFERAKAVGISDSQLYKQAGNAVTSTVSYEIGKSIKEIYG